MLSTPIKISKVVDTFVDTFSIIINKATSGLKFSTFTLITYANSVSLKWGEDLVDSLAHVAPAITILLCTKTALSCIITASQIFL